MSYVPASSADYVKQPQYVEETVEGTIPLNSPLFKNPGIVTDWSPTVKIDNEQVPMLGLRDIYTQVELGYAYTFQVKYVPFVKDLMMYGTELAAGTGTNGKSISFMASKLINGVEKYKVYRGVRCASITVDISRRGGCVVTQNFQCTAVDDWGTSPVFVTPTFASAPNEATDIPWSGIISGSNPLSVAGTNYDTPKFSMTVDQGLATGEVNGELAVKFLRPGHRKITVSFDTYLKDTVLIGAMKAYTTQAMLYHITPTVTATFTGVKFDNYTQSDAGGSNDFSMESFSGTAKTVTLA